MSRSRNLLLACAVLLPCSVATRVHADEFSSAQLRPEYWKQAYWNESTEQWKVIRWYTVDQTPAGTKMNAVDYSLIGDGIRKPSSIVDIERTDGHWTLTINFADRPARYALELKSTDMYEGLCYTTDKNSQPVEVKTQFTRIAATQLRHEHDRLLIDIDNEIRAVEAEDAILQQAIDDEERRIRNDERVGREISVLRRVNLFAWKSRRSVLAIRKQDLYRAKIHAQRAADLFGM